MIIFVEGGGDSNAMLTACRKGFATFFGKMLPGKARPAVVPCGGRSQAFADFKVALENLGNDEHVLLLVDSEEAVDAKNGPWEHLKQRKGDGWEKPPGATAKHVHLLVQCMEAWFIADPDAVAEYFDKGFHQSKLPKPVNGKDVESISKEKIEAGLKAAARDTTKVEYHKTRDGFKLLEKIHPEKVCSLSEHARKLHDRLKELLPNR